MMPDCVHESGDEIDIDGSVFTTGVRGSDGDLVSFIGEVPMKELIGAVSALALMGAAGMALGNEATGKIQSVDEEQMTLILDSGETFTFAEGLSIEGLEEGTEVEVAYEERDGQLMATAIEPVEVARVEEAEEAAEAAEDEPEEAAD
jgi:hypothetical protein